LTPAFTLAKGFPDGVLQPTLNQVNRQVISFDQNMHNGYMEQWNVDVQNELLPNLLVDVAYSASAGHKLTGSRNANQPRPGPGALQPRSPFPQFTSISRVEPFANSNYQALVAKIERRFSGGLTFLTAYTWSHFLDDTQTLLDLMGAGIQDAFNRHAEKGNANYDLRHRFVTSYAYELPIGKGKRLVNRGGAWNALVGGWQINGILAIQAGHPITPTFNVNVANAGGAQRPDRIAPGVIPYGDRTVDRWFDTKAFVSPVGFAFGNRPAAGPVGLLVVQEPSGHGESAGAAPRGVFQLFQPSEFRASERRDRHGGGRHGFERGGESATEPVRFEDAVLRGRVRPSETL